ncbi:MAG: FtsW/RodA/SpoVE family cell cycle protein, partial [Planctomycetaceae bacterium]|nr:FtsW/RodA/SpoVE family cell cycle protein [Planctomycetaceae bacterium]
MREALHRIPWSLLLLALAIMATGLAGLIHADQLYGASRLFERQVIWIALSLPVMLIVMQIPYRLIRPLSFVFYFICIALLVVTLFMPPINGSRRWIPLGFMDFQPSEATRLAFILALAHHLMHIDRHRTMRGLLTPFLITTVPMLLILKEPDLGTALLFLPVLYALLLCAGARIRHLAAAAGMGVILLPVFWQFMSAEQKSRVVSVFTQTDGGTAPD